LWRASIASAKGVVRAELAEIDAEEAEMAALNRV
jgi:hypothetical protein